ncbi:MULTISPECIES: M24 family metallopeptidase [unclassified Beijerinckia]|uniref:M24 family metallopeptidase n=1 Tax=unclassified Beijerinckia TaxID=2638183 RepID=UPI00089B2EE0|nr:MULTISPECIES: M24 family metallopeptidase [unclassified Beijerinckia]MDH7794277.1 Xaa-Pro aminopeptidase [Beijerinckia sp. GAS462]SEB57584.1 Xaa-Pro aminopeptidase [Beijerinckia sp. 28-YEA-48]
MPIDERQCSPISRSELERRWALVRDMMREHRIDLLLCQAANMITGMGGHFRWLTGIPVQSSYPQTVIFRREGLSTIVMHGDFDAVAQLDDKDPASPGVGVRFTAPSFPAVNYVADYDAELVAKELQKSKLQRIGILAPNTWFSSMTTGLRKLLGDVEFVDITSQIDEAKATKSAEEIELIRRTAAMQDAILEKVRTHIKPGMRDFEVMAYGQYVGQMMGSEAGYFLGSSAAEGDPILIRRRIEHGRELRENDVMYFQCENSGAGGEFTHVGRYFALGKVPRELEDVFSAIIEAQEFTISLLKVGASCSEIFAEYNAYMKARGFPPERRVHCHGQGYDVVERPLIRQDETMKLGPSMNMGLHPLVMRKGLFVTCSDNLLITPQGKVERLHKTPREIFRLG